jgi:hypothetical protein
LQTGYPGATGLDANRDAPEWQVKPSRRPARKFFRTREGPPRIYTEGTAQGDPSKMYLPSTKKMYLPSTKKMYLPSTKKQIPSKGQNKEPLVCHPEGICFCLVLIRVFRVNPW